MNSRINKIEERIDLEDRLNGNYSIKTADRNSNWKKKESNIRDLCDNRKQANLLIIGILEEEEEE